MSLKARGLVLIPLLTILIGVAEYGAYVQVVALATVTANVCGLQLDSGYIRYIHNTDTPTGLFSALVVIILVMSSFGGLIFALAADPLAEYTLRDPRFSTLFLLGGIYVPLKCLFQLGRGYFRANRRIKLFSIWEAIDVYLSIAAIAIAILILEAGILGAFTAYLIAKGVVVTMIYAFIGYIGGLGRPRATVLVECVRFSIGSMGHLVSQSLLDKIDRVLIGFFIGASAVGIYSAAYSVAYLMLLYYRPLSISFFPEFSKLWENREYNSIREYSVTGIRFVTALGFPSIAGFWLIGDSVLEILSTTTVATEGVIPLVLLATGMLAKGIGEIYTQLFFAANDSRSPALIQGGSVVVNVLCNLVLIPVFGIAGAAFATVISFTVATSVMTIMFREYFPIRFPWDQTAKVAVATIGMTIPMALLDWNWIVTLLVSPIIYFVFLFVIGGVRASEVRFVVDTIR